MVKSDSSPSTGPVDPNTNTTEASLDSPNSSLTSTDPATEGETTTSTGLDDTTAAPSTEKADEKKPEVSETTTTTTVRPGKTNKSKAPVMDDNDNELKYILQVQLCSSQCHRARKNTRL
jgi:hypothetical protein